MAKKNCLRKQVAALEALAGLESMTAADARRANGGSAAAPKKSKKTTGALVARGTGAIMVKGSGALLYRPGLGG